MANIRVIAIVMILFAFAASMANAVTTDVVREALEKPNGATIALEDVYVDNVLGAFAFVSDPFGQGLRPSLPVYVGSFVVEKDWSLDITGVLASAGDRRILIAREVTVYTGADGKEFRFPFPFRGHDWPYTTPAETQTPATDTGALPSIPEPESKPIMPISARAGTVAAAKFPTSAPTRVQSLSSVSALSSTPPQLESGQQIELTGRPITAVYHLSDGTVSFFYVQENIVGGNGIKCVPTVAVPVEPGNLVDITGNVEVVSGEAQLTVKSVTCTGSTPRPSPIGLNNRATAAGAFGIQPALYLKTSDALPSSGLSAVGTRVRVWGSVLSSATENGHTAIWVDDGSGLSTTAHNGLKIVYWNPSDAPTGQTYISLTGILGAEMADGKAIPVVRVPESTPWETPRGVKYVKPDSVRTKNGLSWDTAYSSVQDAINAANSANPKCEVWVAAGIYDVITLANGVAVYGGFVGGETLREQRNWSTHTTTLDGNSYTVVIVPNGTTASARIDGFTLRNGQASSLYGSNGGGIYSLGSAIIAHNQIFYNRAASYGGGIYCSGGTPLIWNNVIKNNTVYSPTETYNSGGGIYTGSSSAKIIDNVISNNSILNTKYGSSIQVRGGGIYCDSGSPRITGNTISDNIVSTYYGTTKGSGIYSNNASLTLLNNTVLHNTGSGEGIYVSSGTTTIANNVISSNAGSGISLSNGTPRLTNNTVVSNSKGISFTFSDNTAVITNNIVAFNSSTGISKTGSGNPRANYNCVYNPGGTDYSGLTAGANDLTGVNANPIFLNLAEGNVHIMPNSPCIDLGYDLDVQNGWVDMDGDTRIQRTHVDIGADEAPECWRYLLTLTPAEGLVAPNGTQVAVNANVFDGLASQPASDYQADISVDAGEIVSVTRNGVVFTLPSGTKSTYGITDENGEIGIVVTRPNEGYVHVNCSIGHCSTGSNATKAIWFYNPTLPTDIEFVIDRSGSMDVHTASWPAEASVQKLVREISSFRPNTRFGAVMFNDFLASRSVSAFTGASAVDEFCDFVYNNGNPADGTDRQLDALNAAAADLETYSPVINRRFIVYVTDADMYFTSDESLRLQLAQRFDALTSSNGGGVYISLWEAWQGTLYQYYSQNFTTDPGYPSLAVNGGFDHTNYSYTSPVDSRYSFDNLREAFFSQP